MKVVHTASLSQKRARRVRAKLVGTLERPRVSVFRSNQHTTAQVIDDAKGKTLTTVSSHIVRKGQKEQKEKLTKTQAAAQVGKTLAGLLAKQNIRTVVFDRGPYKYHGRVKAIAESLRAEGVEL